MSTRPDPSPLSRLPAAASGPAAASESYWFWLDLEMTGLDPQTDRLLEAAAIVTRVTPQMTPVAQFETAVFQPPQVLEAMNDWCKKTHGESGLTARVSQGITEAELDAALCQLADTYWPQPAATTTATATADATTTAAPTAAEKIILCGNSIGQDRKFVDRYLPRFAQKLHYRMLDVSSFKIVYQQRLGVSFPKKGSHRALDDIRESIAELEFYLGYMGAPASGA